MCVLPRLGGDGYVPHLPLLILLAGFDNSLCQALPLARWAVTYLWLLF